jgi:hypothetical protein
VKIWENLASTGGFLFYLCKNSALLRIERRFSDGNWFHPQYPIAGITNETRPGFKVSSP